MNAPRATLISLGARLAAAAAVVLGLVGSAPALAQVEGWPQFQGDAAHTGAASATASPPYRQAWRFDEPGAGPAHALGLSAPVVAGSAIIAVAPRAVVAVDASSGSQLWTVTRDFGPSVPPAVAASGKRELLLYTEGFGGHPPSVSPSATASVSPSPSSVGRTIDSHLTAIDLATHRSAWKTPLQLHEVSRTGVTVDGDTAFVGDNRGNVYAVDVATGKLRWSAKTGGFLMNALAVANGLVVASVQGNRTTRAHLEAFKEADGSRAWDTEVQGAAVLASSPAITDGRVLVGYSDQTIRSFGLSDGLEQWSTRLNSPLFSLTAPAVAGDALVIADLAGQVYRLDLRTGARVWDFALNEPVVRSPMLIAGDHALVATARGTLASFDMASGNLIWRNDATGSILRSLTPTADAVVAVAGGPRPGLVAFENDPNGQLVSIVTPTKVDPVRFVGAYALAAVPLALVLLFAGRPLRARMGPAFLDEEDASEGDEGSD